jgi:hypothetical protein
MHILIYCVNVLILCFSVCTNREELVTALTAARAAAAAPVIAASEAPAVDVSVPVLEAPAEVASEVAVATSVIHKQPLPSEPPSTSTLWTHVGAFAAGVGIGVALWSLFRK